MYLSFSASNDILKDGTYNIRGHIIEIRNGVRVSTPSTKTKQENKTIEEQSSSKTKTNNVPFNNNGNVNSHTASFQQTIYEPKFYLNSHLNNLLCNDQQDNFLSNINDNKDSNSNIDIFNQETINDLQQKQQDGKRTAPSPTDSLCSNDSLNNSNDIEENVGSSSSHWEQRMLRSSLKGSSSTRMSNSLSRKVTFSDSIEFNDGDTQPTFTPPTKSIPLYKRMEQASSMTKIDVSPFQGSDSTTHVNQNRGYAVVTTEQLLDQLRQEALLPRYPHNGDFSYPDSVAISQTPSNVAVVSPLIPNNSNTDGITESVQTQQQTKPVPIIENDPSNTDNQQLDSLDSLNSSVVKDSIEIARRDTNKTDPKQSDNSMNNSYVIECDPKNDVAFSSKSDAVIDYMNDTTSNQKAIVDPPQTKTTSNQTLGTTHVESLNDLDNKVSTLNGDKLSHNTNYFETKIQYNQFPQQQQQQIQQTIPVSTISNIAEKPFHSGKSETFFNKSKPPLQQSPLTSVNKTESTYTSKGMKYKTPTVTSSHDDQSTNSPYHTSNQKTPKNGNSYAAKHVTAKSSTSTNDKTHSKNKDSKEFGSKFTCNDQKKNSVKTNCTEMSCRKSKDSTDSVIKANSKITNITSDVHCKDVVTTTKDDVASSTAHFQFSNQDFDRWESQRKSEHKNTDSDSPTNDIVDDIYKSVEQSMACITFENRNEMNPVTAAKFDQDSINDKEENIVPYVDKTESEKISTAVKDGTSIPVRVHSSNIRRGRIIVSANSKKRKQQQNQHQTVDINFTPHPPPSKSKNTKLLENYEGKPLEVPLLNSGTPLQQHQRKRTSTGERGKPLNNHSRTKSHPRLITSASSRLNNAPVASRHQNTNKLDSTSRASTAVQAKTPMKDTYIPTSATTVLEKPSQNPDKFYDNFDKNYSKNSNNKIHPEIVPHSQGPLLNASNRLPLDKTPTDDEINKLWANVRDCLSTEVPEHAFSDSICVVEPKKQHQRSSSGTSFHRRSNSGNVRMSKTHPNKSNLNSHRRIGSQEIIFHRENSLDSVSSASSFSRRQALLPQRVNRLLSPSIYKNTNSVGKKPSPVRVTEPQRWNTGKEEKSEGSNMLFLSNFLSFFPLKVCCTK